MKLDKQEVVKELLSPVLNQDDVFCLTAYFAFNDYSQKEYPYRLKSFLKEGLRDKKELEGFSRAHNRILDSVERHMEEVEQMGEGVAVFVRFNRNNLEKREEPTDEDLKVNVVPLWKKPEEEVFIGKVFDIDQLTAFIQSDSPTLVINIKREDAQLFTFKRGLFQKLVDIQNPFAVDKEASEYMAKHRPMKGQSTAFGTGTKNVQSREDEEERRFLSEIVKYLKDNREQILPIEKVITFYSENFEDIDKLKEKVHGTFQEVEIKLIKENIQKEDRLEEETKKIVNEDIASQIDAKLSEAREANDLYTEDWDEIAEASRQGRIKRLFKKNGILKKGYVDNDYMVYLNNAGSYTEVNNIVPWIVRNTVDSSGRVDVLSNEEVDFEIAASLRYNP